MAYFERLAVLGKGGYKEKVIDINRVESFESNNEHSVRVTMVSGKEFVVMMDMNSFDDLCFKTVDEYGRLLVASLN